jgi:hypothetical protein
MNRTRARSPLFRYLITTAASIILGLLTTVSTTWLIAAFLPRTPARMSYADRVASYDQFDRKALYLLVRAERMGYLSLCPDPKIRDPHGDFHDAESSPSMQQLIPTWAAERLTEYWSQDDSHRQLMIESFGWPFLAAFGDAELAFRYGSLPLLDKHRGIMMRRIQHQSPFLKYTMPAILPCRPIWSGFLLNTSIYAATWFLLLVAPRTLRRRSRVRHGRCPSCAYDLKGQATEGCPECGWKRLTALS